MPSANTTLTITRTRCNGMSPLMHMRTESIRRNSGAQRVCARNLCGVEACGRAKSMTRVCQETGGGSVDIE